jgi:hypothetical protein
MRRPGRGRPVPQDGVIGHQVHFADPMEAENTGKPVCVVDRAQLDLAKGIGMIWINARKGRRALILNARGRQDPTAHCGTCRRAARL